MTCHRLYAGYVSIIIIKYVTTVPIIGLTIIYVEASIGSRRLVAVQQKWLLPVVVMVSVGWPMGW